MHVVTWDCPGIGQSEQRDEPFTIQDEVGDMVAVMDAAGLDSAVVYGRSRGGMLALAHSAALP